MAEVDFYCFLTRCLDAIERDAQLAYRALCQQLASCLVHLNVDGKRGSLRASPQRVVVRVHDIALLDVVGAADEPAVLHTLVLETSRDAIAQLVDGVLSLIDALLGDALMLRGSADAIIVAHEALMLFLKGAVRSPSLPGLLDAYLGRQAFPQPSVSKQEAS